MSATSLMYQNLMEAMSEKADKDGNIEVGDIMEFETETSPRSPSKGRNIIVKHTVTQEDLATFREYYRDSYCD